MIKHYFKTAWRNLVRQRVNSLINIAGLSIGMAAAILIFLWVKNEFSFDNYHKDADRIFRVKNFLTVNKTDTWVWEHSPYLLGENAKQQIPEVLDACRIRSFGYGTQYFNIKGQFYEEKACAYIDSSWFNVFNYKFIAGSAQAFNEHPFSMLLTATKAKKYFGNENAVGRVIRIDTVDYQVQGVLADNPVNSSFQYDVLIPLAARFANPKNKKNDEQWGNFNYLTFLKLTPSADPKKIAATLKAIIAKQRDNNNLDLSLLPLKDLRFENDVQNSVMQHSNIKVVYIFTVLGILLLLIACINYVNLTTSRATLRAKEVSIRKIIGAEKKQLFAQFITESVLISLLSLFVTIIIVQLFLPLFNRFTEKIFALSFTSPGLWIIAGSTLLVTILLTSIYPAILLSSFKPLSIFRGLNVLQIKDGALRKGLVVVQFTISIVLIVGTIVTYNQLQFINKQHTAYNRSQLLSVSIPYKIWGKYEEEQRIGLTASFKKELLSKSNIADVSLMNSESIINNGSTSSGNSTDWPGRAEDFTPTITFIRVDTSFKNMVNLQLKEGRWYETGNLADQHNSVLNETAVREFNIPKPVIGQRFVSQGDTGVIIGVAEDFYYKSLHEKIGPVVIRTMDENNTTFLIKTAAGKIKEAEQAAETVWKKFFPAEPFSASFLDEEFEKLYRADNKTSTLIWSFSIIAIFISCLGLFGLAAFTAERRNKEIGIRKILGASIANIVSLLSREFVYMVLLSMVIAFPIAWLAMNKWLENFAYRINIDWWIFLTAAIIALAIAIITVSFQAIKAAMANPVKSLKAE
jgi:ABC-type antimicrobial peptide transport system permease subunit